MTPAPPDPDAAARWRAVALALAACCALLVALLFISLKANATASGAAAAASAGQKEASPDDGDAGVAAAQRGRIEGTVLLSGTPPVMQVSPRRKYAEYCKAHPQNDNVVVVSDGRLKDVLVRIEHGGVKGDHPPPDEHAVLDHVDCMFTPRIQGAMIGQDLDVRNRDPVLHSVHVYGGPKSTSNKAEPAGAPPLVMPLDTPGIFKFVCDVHPWERAFIAVTDHPFHTVTDASGAFALEEVPAGRYTLEAWHARYGLRKTTVEVGGAPASVKITFETTDPEPELNRGELTDPW